MLLHDADQGAVATRSTPTWSPRYGADQVGLLTGDNTVNGEAPVVVMTTEVLRNMLYAGSPHADGLGYVVMDEVHYLADRFRGAVWEEVIIHLPESVRLVSLSATVSNAEEFGDWLATVRGDTDGRRRARTARCRCGSTCWSAAGCSTCSLRRRRRSARSTPSLDRGSARRDDASGSRRGGAATGGGGRAAAAATPAPAVRPRRVDVVERLDRRRPAARDLLHLQPGRLRRRRRAVPARRAPAHRRRASGTRSARSSSERAAHLPDEDLDVLGYWEWLRRAASAASPPTTRACCRPSRRSSRSCSSAGWSRWCSPPRRWRSASTCRRAPWCSRSSTKWNGETPRRLTPGEYTQLTGRAGRRGIDVEGHAVVQWQPGARPAGGRRPGLARRTYPLRSRFRPTTTWRSTWSARSGRDAGPRDPRVLVRPVPGRPGRGRASPARCASTRRPWRATPRR